MRKFVVLAVAVLLSACAHPDPNTHAVQPDASRPVQIPEGQGAVVIGLTVSQSPPNILGLAAAGPTNAAWVAIDPHTGMRNGPQILGAGLPCKLFDCAAASGDRTDYTLAVLPPGTYSMAWISDHGAMFPTSQFKDAELLISSESSTFRVFPLDARAMPVAPSFTVRAGEVAYVGDLDFDFSRKNEVRWTHRYNDAAARGFLAKTGLADHMARQPMTRANGQPMGKADAVTNKN